MFKVYRWTKALSWKPRCLSAVSYSLYSTCSWNLQSELKVTHESTPTALPRFKNVIFRHHYVMQKNSSCIETEKSYLNKVLHFNRQNLMLIAPPNDWATAYGNYWKYPTEHRSKKYKQPAPSNVFLNGARAQFLNQLKYLGVWINASLKDDLDIQRQVKSLYCAANKLRGTFDQCTPVVKNTLFRAYCMPMYACQLWSKYTQTSMKRLRAAYNNAYWIMHYIPRNVSVRPHQVSHCVTTFDAVLRNNLYRFFNDVHLHPTILFDRFKCLMLFTNLHFPQLFNTPVWRINAVVVRELSRSLRLTSIAFV